MVLIRTPLRVSLMGGGTDLPAFFHRSRGRVVCTAITRYIYLWIRAGCNARVAPPHGFDLACATRWDDASESILQASLQVCPQAVDVRVTTFTDVPAGNGLGSSSSFTVGVLHGLHAFRGEAPSAETLAAEACQVEIERLGKRIGVQDQYIAAYGGLRGLTFERDGGVRAEAWLCSSGTRLALRRRLIVIFTGVQRPSGVLDDVIRDMESNEGVLQSMAERASALASDLRAGNVDAA